MRESSAATSDSCSGLLVVLSMASEVEALPIHLSAVAVLVHMAAGYAIGWLIQPLIKALFPQ